jgi:hypothetical protein
MDQTYAREVGRSGYRSVILNIIHREKQSFSVSLEGSRQIMAIFKEEKISIDTRFMIHMNGTISYLLKVDQRDLMRIGRSGFCCQQRVKSIRL